MGQYCNHCFSEFFYRVPIWMVPDPDPYKITDPGSGDLKMNHHNNPDPDY
jgi:hypothetical protein